MNNLPSSNVGRYSDKLEIPGFIIERTAKRMKQYFQRLLKDAKANITADQWVVIHLLYKNDNKGISQLDIARHTFKDAPTITRIIDLLCTKELVERTADANDRRRFNIYLTEKGKQKVEDLMPLAKDFRITAWKGLSEDKMQELVKSLNVIFDNLGTPKK